MSGNIQKPHCSYYVLWVWRRKKEKEEKYISKKVKQQLVNFILCCWKTN